MIIEVIVVFLVVILIYKTTSKPARLPPGSFGLPVFGSIPPRNVHITEHLRNLKKIYGNIYTTKWGSRVVIVLADVNWIKKAMNHPGLQGRGFLSSLTVFGNGLKMGVSASSGKIWSDNRRFLITHLRDLGMGTTHLEHSIMVEAKMLVDHLEMTSVDKPVELDWSINVAILNVIWQMLAGKRYNVDDNDIIQFNKIVTEDFKIVQGSLALVRFMPWISKIFPNFLIDLVTKRHVLESPRQFFVGLCKETIEEHKASLDPDNPKDYIDYYLLEIEANKHDPESTFRPDHMDLISIMGDMFVAGSETTSSTLRWIILHMALRPDIQKQGQSDIDAVVPRDRLPSLADRPMLPYVDAMVLDVMRLSSLGPTSIPHFATETITLDGYIIPKDAIVLTCMELCHKDATLWRKPDVLYPEHFLDDQGNLESKKDAFMPFGTGRRQCLAQSLVRVELFLFASAILQRFNIEAPPGLQLMAKTCPNDQHINIPEPFKVVLKKRI